MSDVYESNLLCVLSLCALVSQDLMSTAGMFFLVAITPNDIPEIEQILSGYSFQSEVCVGMYAYVSEVCVGMYANGSEVCVGMYAYGSEVCVGMYAYGSEVCVGMYAYGFEVCVGMYAGVQYGVADCNVGLMRFHRMLSNPKNKTQIVRRRKVRGEFLHILLFTRRRAIEESEW